MLAGEVMCQSLRVRLATALFFGGEFGGGERLFGPPYRTLSGPTGGQIGGGVELEVDVALSGCISGGVGGLGILEIAAGGGCGGHFGFARRVTGPSMHTPCPPALNPASENQNYFIRDK